MGDLDTDTFVPDRNQLILPEQFSAVLLLYRHVYPIREHDNERFSRFWSQFNDEIINIIPSWIGRVYVHSNGFQDLSLLKIPAS